MRIFYRFLNNLNMVDCLMLKFIYDSFFLIFVRFYMNVFINGKLKLCEYINRSFINNIFNYCWYNSIEEMCCKE